MTWQIDGHELYLAMVFPDGQTGSGYRGNQVSAGEVDGVEQWRPANDVVAFAVTCECSIGETWRTESTVLARWERVRSADLEDLVGGRLFAFDVDDVFAVDDRDDVAERMLALWALHREPQERTVALEQAWSRHRQALADVDEAVRAARAAGLSWVDVGRATGMTRQSARERWGTL